MSAQAKQCRRVTARYGFRGQRIGEASNPGPPRRRSQFDTQLDSSDSDGPLVRCGRFAVLSDVRVNVRIITAVHADVESRGFKRLRRTQCDGRRVGSRQDSTMSEDRGLLDSLAHDLEFDGDVLA